MKTLIAAALGAIALASVVVVILLMQPPPHAFGESINNTLTVEPP